MNPTQRLVVGGLAVLLVAASASPALAREKPRRFGAAAAPIRLIPSTDLPLILPGLHDYFGTIELGSASDGLVVVNRLSLERYLLGLQEVPTDWPREALRAQAVAARTYALWTLERPPAGAGAIYGFDICASVECQVFAGADVVRSTDGPNWAAAVAATKGRAIVYQGRPILARYHSTSGGMTLDNAQAFRDERSYAYLQPVDSPWERNAPLYRWRVTFRVRALQAILERGGLWDRSRGRLTDAFTIESRSGLPYPDVVLKGSRRRLVVTAQELRETVGVHAPVLFSSRYPSKWPTVSGFLPETLPSNRIDATTRRETVTVIGRGWGHGVGMSQWGAYGLANTGAAYQTILTHYYTGATVEAVSDPGAISVGLSWGEPTVAVKGAFKIVDGRGRTLVRAALGTWRFRWAGSGVVKLDPPAGYRLPLQVGVVNAPYRVVPGRRVRLTVALSRPAIVRVLAEGEPDGQSGARVMDAGRRSVPWRVPTESGRYRVQVEASTGRASRRSEAVEIVVVGAPGARERAAGDDSGGDAVVPVVLVLGALLGVAGVALARKMAS